jgi:predicted RNA-binding Zn-ribbon protein involved in translation (DUF1610 family)
MAEKPSPVFVFGCVSCGKTVSGDERLCPRCGATFEDVRFECPFCGELTSPDEGRCKSCGTEFAVFADNVADAASIALDGMGGTEGPVEFECPNCGKKVAENDQKCPHCGVVFS